MSLRNTLEDNVVIFFVGALLSGFVTGWGAHVTIQNAAGLTPVPSWKAKLLDGDMPDRLVKAEGEVITLRKQLQQNLPTGNTYVSNIVVSPPSPGQLSVQDHVVVDFDYVVAPGRTARIFAEQLDSTASGSFQPSPLVQGAGHASRYFELDSPGMVKSFSVRVQAPDGENLYKMSVPVDFTYK